MLPDSHILGVFLVAVTVLMVTPGPDMLFIAANGIAQGPRAGLVSALGVGVGCLVHTVLAAIGVSALVLASPVAFDAIRFAGAAYLAWLGVQAIRNPSMLELHVQAARRRPAWTIFRGGVLCNVLNPKVAIFFIAFLPQFADPDVGALAIQLVTLGVLFTIVGTSFNMLVGLSGGEIGRYLATRPGIARIQGWISGLVFLALAVRLAVVGRTS